MIELVYETHATTTDNEEGIATGWLPGRLSAQGWEQARDLGRRRANDRIDAVYASDLKRAVDTADLAFGSALLDWRLRECNYGELNGSRKEKIKPPEHVDTPYPGGESYRDVVERTESFLRDLRDGTRVLVIAHLANLWALEHLANGTPLEELATTPFEWRPGWEFRF